MKFLIISPYHGGSHKAWAEGYQQYGRNETILLTLPARFWKWRMHGGAITLARQFLEQSLKPDLILATDMTDLTTFVAMTRDHIRGVPIVLYMHENQLTYPLPDDPDEGPMRRQQGERDLHYAFINVASMVIADQILFNTDFHRQSFFQALPNFLKHFPEYNELDLVPELAQKSETRAVGVNLRRFDNSKGETAEIDPTGSPLILWNQRWEYDKNPADFFDALYAVAGEGIPFRLALCGENFRRIPTEFAEASIRLKDQIIHYGYAEGALYHELLREAAVTISTAHHEFFGISIVEAVYNNTFPLLPNRLSYPELFPTDFHSDCLYSDQKDLHEKLSQALQNKEQAAKTAASLSRHFVKYDWHTIAPIYDQFLEQLV
jgi:glycosyltransferase involved in cell wall biosynthesis